MVDVLQIILSCLAFWWAACRVQHMQLGRTHIGDLLSVVLVGAGALGHAVTVASDLYGLPVHPSYERWEELVFYLGILGWIGLPYLRGRWPQVFGTRGIAVTAEGRR